MNKNLLFSDEKLQLITGQIFVGHGILICYQLGLFELLNKKSMTIKDLSVETKLSERAVQALISCACVLKLIQKNHRFYCLSPLGKVFLDKTKKSYYGDVFELFVQENNIMNYENIKKAILTNKSQVNNGKELFFEKDSLCNTEKFIKSLHQKAFNPAFFWSSKINFLKHKKIIDIGGGSGIHTIAVCLNNPHIEGIVCDRQSVLPFTKRYIADFNLESRIKVNKLDMWKDEFPIGDVYFWGDIFHDWDKDKCLYLAKKCFCSLKKNGKIIIHEMLFNDKKTGPLLTAAYNMKMMVWTQGQQFSRSEIKDLLKKVGFSNIKIKKSLGNWSIIIGEKK